MANSRERILGRVRRSLGRDVLTADQQRSVLQRLNNPVRHCLPVVDDDLPQRFVQKLEQAAATVERIVDLAAVPAAVNRYRDKNAIESVFVVAPALENLSWPEDTVFGATRGEHQLSVTPCFAAVAETGSVVLLSGESSPTLLNFLPDDHVVVVQIPQIVKHIEDVWAELREQTVGDQAMTMPRTVNFITGPSRTADVEQTIQLGAHGPRRLHVLLVEN